MATIGVCTSATEFNVNALLQKLNAVTHAARIKFVHLSYNDLDDYRLEPEKLDGLVLCHSIQNRRFAITDVMDALYDVFLPHARNVLGKDNITVIVHDMPWPLQSAQGRYGKNQAEGMTYEMETFRSLQPTTFKCCSLAIICGKLDTEVEMEESDWKQLEKFAQNIKEKAPPPFQRHERNGGNTTLLRVVLIALAVGSLITAIVVWENIPGLSITIVVLQITVIILPCLCLMRVRVTRVDSTQVLPLMDNDIMRARSSDIRPPWSADPLWKVPITFWEYYISHGFTCIEEGRGRA